MDDDVSSGKVTLYGRGGCHGDLLGALKGEVSRHAEGNVGEVAGTGAAGANALDGENAIDGRKVAHHVASLGAGFDGSGIGEGVDGASG